jgi:hypothetical protein
MKFCAVGATGNGVSAGEKASHGMAESLNSLAKKGSHSMPKRKKGAPSVTAAEALAMLESAVEYCQKAGLTIHSGNVPYLCLSIEQALMEGNPPRFVLSLGESIAEKDVTSSTSPNVMSRSDTSSGDKNQDRRLTQNTDTRNLATRR